MPAYHSRAGLGLATAAALALTPASAAWAQRQPATPEQRIERLERQIEQLQRQVFPRGRPADTAGFAAEPAATQSSVSRIDQRLDAMERQMSDMLRQSEENGHLARTVQSDVAKMRNDSEARLSAIEQRLAAGVVAAPEPAAVSPDPAGPVSEPKPKPKPVAGDAGIGGPATGAGDAAEAAYTEGFKLWESGQYDQAIRSLRAFTKKYPRHRRTSFANNLVGRALLDKGDARGATEALLANYRGNPGGERAPDSLFYLGQALMKLGQPSQACKAYAELDAVYGSKIRPDLKKLEDEAKADAKCGQ